MNSGWIRKVTKATVRPERYRWWHAVGFWVAGGAISGLLTRRGGTDRQDNQRLYEEMEQAPFAPPEWVFGPAWAINNAITLWGNLRLLNAAQGEVPNRRVLLALQGASWLSFFAFGWVYFRKKSPILGLIDTAAMWAFTVASVAQSLKDGRRDIALSLGTLLAWLTLATPTAAYQAAKNPDEFFGTRPWR